MRQFLSIALSILIGPVFCQMEPSMTMGSTHKQRFRDLYPTKVLGEDERGIYMQRQGHGDSLTFEMYGHDLRLKVKNSFLPRIDGRKMDTWHILPTKDGYRLLARIVDARTDTAIFYHCPIEMERLEPTGQWTELGKIDTKGRRPTVRLTQGRFGRGAIELGSKERGTRKQYHTSYNSETGHRLFFTEYIMGKDEPCLFDLVVVDENIQHRWSAQVALDENGNGFDLDHISLDDDGNVYLLGKADQADVQGTFKYRIYGINEAGIVLSHTVDLGDRRALTASLTHHDDEIVVAGFYTEGSSKLARGTFMERLDKRTGSVIANSQHPFQESLFLKLHGQTKGVPAYARFASNVNQGVDQLYVSRILITPGGGCMIVGERRGFERNLYCAWEMIMFQINEDGTLRYDAVILKRQEVPFDRAMRSVMIIQDKEAERVLFLFNDSHANSDPVAIREGNVKRWIIEKGTITLAVLDANGHMDRRGLMDFKEAGCVLYASANLSVGAKEHLVLCRFMHDERWLRFEW